MTCIPLRGARLAVAFMALLAVAHGSAAQTAPAATDSGQGPAAEPAAQPLPASRGEIGQRYAELIDAAASARRRLDDLSGVDDLRAEAARLKAQGESLGRRLDTLLGDRRTGLDELFAVRAALGDYRDQLSSLSDRLAARLGSVDSERQSWQQRRDLWQRWRSDLSRRGELQGYRDDFRRALATIDEVLAAEDAAALQVGPVQSEVVGLQEDLLDMEDRLASAQAERRARLLDRDAPILLSAAHRAAVAAAGSQVAAGLKALGGAGGEPDAGTLQRYAPLVFMGLAVLLASAALVRASRRRYAATDPRWRILLSHPWAIGVFVAVATTLPLYRPPPPPLWRLGFLVALAAASCVLTRGMFRNRRKRRVVYVLAALYVVLRALETVSFPHPLYRLVLAAAALGGAPYLAWLARSETGTIGRRTAFANGLLAGAAAFAVVLVAQLLGFDSLSRWLLEGSLATGFTVFVTIFLLRLGHGALRALLRRPREGRLRWLRQVGWELSERLMRLLQALLVGGAAIHVLTIWGVFETSTQAWRRVTGAGFDLGSHHFTVAQLLWAVAALYVAVVASAVLRGLLDDEMRQREHLTPGLADSAKTLLHYTLILVGLTAALMTVGFDLSTFALVAGALGVGIGFGLQNIVNNFVSGLVLLFERPVRVGDVVMLDGEWATIRKIGLRSTVVQSFEMAEIIVPNSDLISQKVVNWTLSDSTTRLLIPVGVAYGSDVEAVFRILGEAVAAQPEVVAEPEPRIHFAGFGDSSLDFEVRVWVAEVSQRLDTRSALLREIDRRFREAGVEIPFPQRDLHLRSVDAAAGERLGGGKDGGDAPPRAG